MLATTPRGLPLPALAGAQTVVSPPEDKRGAGGVAPPGVCADGRIYLAYRLRRPIGEGRGYRNVVAVSDDGVLFSDVCHVDREMFSAESLERPTLTVTPEGRWRLYVSCATPGT